MERLGRIGKVSIKERPGFPEGPHKWYVSMEKIVGAEISMGGSCIFPFIGNGCTPHEAAQNAWKDVLELAQSKENALMRFNCASSSPIPGEEPQVWVRWNENIDDWEDIPVPVLPPEQLRPYREQRSIDRR